MSENMSEYVSDRMSVGRDHSRKVVSIAKILYVVLRKLFRCIMWVTVSFGGNSYVVFHLKGTMEVSSNLNIF